MPSPLHPPHHPNATPRASGAKLKVPASLRRFDATDGNNSLGVDVVWIVVLPVESGEA